MSSLEVKVDQAAKALKSRMGLPESEVPNGLAYRSAPPPGSYAAMARQRQMQDAQQRDAQRRESAEELARIPRINTNPGEDPPQLPQDAVADGGDGPPGQPPPPDHDPQLSARAKARIETLARERRDFERRANEAQAQNDANAKRIKELEERADALQRERQELLQANLDHLDPEARTRVMTEASARHAAAATRQELLSEMAPVLDEIKQNQFQMALNAVANKYAAFDYELHAPKVAAMMKQHPGLSAEQAFRAIAEDEELGVNPLQSVPPVLHPRGSRGTQQIAPPPPKDPDLDLVEQRNQWKEMARSTDPAVRREADKLLHVHLKNRLGMR